MFRWQSATRDLHTYTDSDWAGDKISRKSTSGGVAMLGNHCIKAWSTNQQVIALSSGEAEYYGLVKGASVALGIQSIMRDLGIKTTIQLLTDASAAKGIANRMGLGKVRHIEVTQLWLQQNLLSSWTKLPLLKLK